MTFISHGASLTNTENARTAAIYCALDVLYCTTEDAKYKALGYPVPQEFLTGVLRQRLQVPLEVELEIQHELQAVTADLDDRWVVVGYEHQGRYVQFTMLAHRSITTEKAGVRPELFMFEADDEEQRELGWALQNALKHHEFRQMLAQQNKRVLYVTNRHYLPLLALSVHTSTGICDHVVGPSNRQPTQMELAAVEELLTRRGSRLKLDPRSPY